MLRFLLAAVLALSASAAQAKPPVWIVKDRDSELVLFGSVHVLPAGLDWRPARLEAALKTADDLWFEMPMDAAARAESSRLAMEKGVLPEGQTLSSLLSADGAARLKRLAAAFGLSLAQLDRLKPWYAESALAVAQYRRSGAELGTGVEQSLEASAPSTVARRAFEAPIDQISLLDATPMPRQIAALETSMRELEEKPKSFDRLVEAWMKGDVNAIARDAVGPFRENAPEIFAQLVDRRNAAWTRTLHARLRGRGRTVVVVGMGHLIGPQGLPERLRALGYSVEGP